MKKGERFTIIEHGRAVADVVPTQSPHSLAKPQTRKKEEEQEREAAFERLRNPRITGISGDTVLEWIREGRK